MANRYPLVLDKDNQRIRELPASDNLDLSGTGAVILPVGTTAQRPVPPIVGMFRFNTSIGKFEGYNGVEWVDLTAPAPVDPGEFTGEGDLETQSGVEDLETGTGTIDLMN